MDPQPGNVAAAPASGEERQPASGGNGLRPVVVGHRRAPSDERCLPRPGARSHDGKPVARTQWSAKLSSRYQRACGPNDSRS